MPNPRLVLSLFPGAGALDEGFRRAGFCVVTAGDLAWSSFFDVRNCHPPRGIFDGVIGGDPCQSHSVLANLVRAKGLAPSFPDLTPEFERVIGEARPRWFFRENVPGAPDLRPDGYAVASFLLDHSTMDAGEGTGHEQIRRGRFWFGAWGDTVPELRAHLNFATFVLPDHDDLGPEAGAARRRKRLCGDRRSSFIHGGQMEVEALERGDIETVERSESRPRHYTIDEMLDLQGLPRNLFDHAPLTMVGKRQLVGNAVPLPMAEALGEAVKAAMLNR